MKALPIDGVQQPEKALTILILQRVKGNMS